jgi:hypothetical protein
VVLAAFSARIDAGLQQIGKQLTIETATEPAFVEELSPAVTMMASAPESIQSSKRRAVDSPRAARRLSTDTVHTAVRPRSMRVEHDVAEHHVCDAFVGDLPKRRRECLVVGLPAAPADNATQSERVACAARISGLRPCDRLRMRPRRPS